MRPGPASSPDCAGTAPAIVLCADDYGIAAGVSRAILELAHLGRLSATSAMVTFPRWPEDAPALARARHRIAAGLHINLTVGRPLGPMPRLAPDGVLPPIGRLTVAALLGRIDTAEIEAEVARQIDRFAGAVGHPPDHIDGHQHAHALPGVRAGVLAAVRRRLGPAATAAGWCGPLVRDPADGAAAILRRGGEVGKALAVRALAMGFAGAARRAGVPVNRGFSGFSTFAGGRDYAAELATAMRHAGPLHVVMCHPGHPDAELAARDPVTTRRAEELAALLVMPGLEARIWHPARAPGGPPVDWRAFPAAVAGEVRRDG